MGAVLAELWRYGRARGRWPVVAVATLLLLLRPVWRGAVTGERETP